MQKLATDLATPAVQVMLQDRPTRSNFGGRPCLPQGVDWPEKDGRKLAFLARISLSEVHHAATVDWLPAEGALLFFYDVEQQPWGFDPKDRGSWAVLHVPDLERPPESTDKDDSSPLRFKYAAFGRVFSYPTWERRSVAKLKLTDAEMELYADLADGQYQGSPKHQISGFPSPVQGDSMELDCQLVSNGLYCGDSSGYNDPRARLLQPGSYDWRLLLQIDADDDLEVMWGDCGTLYFWVQEQPARAADFSGAWLILQSF